MKRTGIFVLVLMVFVAQQTLAGSPPPDPKIVSAHTSGDISGKSAIKVRFVTEMVEPDAVGKALAESPFTFDPDIKGNAVWSDKNALEFRPDSRLPGGQKYAVTVDLSKFPNLNGTFTFDFAVIPQSYEMTVHGLESESGKDKKTLRLIGVIQTADAEEGFSLMKMLKAEHDGKGVNIQWTHANKGREHRFEIGGIRRDEKPTLVVLTCDGSHIGVDKKAEQTIEVPAYRPFEALRATAMEGETQHIELRFSDPVKKDQDLNGLIRVDGFQDLRFTVDGSIVRVHGSTRWTTELNVTVTDSVKNLMGQSLDKPVTFTVTFQQEEPQVRFVGKGVIIPTTSGMKIPIETVNLRAVMIVATRIYEETTPQFLQVNSLDGDTELTRVGKVVWKKTVSLDYKPENRNKWIRYGLDVSKLVQDNPGGLFRLSLSFKRQHAIGNCDGSAFPQPEETAEETPDDIPDETAETGEQEASNWDYYDQSYNYWDYYEQRNNPCHPAYYRKYDDHDITVARNVLISDIGLIAKKGSAGKLFVAATDIRTATPLPNAIMTVLNFHQQKIGKGMTDSDGMAVIDTEGTPFLLIANHDNQTGYLKLDNGSALAVSHFDVSGQTVTKGLKGFIYGERGVWRPGDPIYLTFILFDPDKTLPADHPVQLELVNPKGQIVNTIKTKESVNGFYSFTTGTRPDAPTGDWMARVRVGGAIFENTLKIEMVMPNRLKIKFDFGEGKTSISGGEISGELSAMWLHGAIAKNLKADMNVSLNPRATRFDRFDEFVFDDPVRTYTSEKMTVFDGELDENGKTTVKAEVRAENVSPGMLTASFLTRVFEPGGAFSSDRFAIAYHPYDQYVGVRLPKGDKARGMLLTDTPHTVRLALIDKDGTPVKKGKVQVSIYKIKWQWWWEKGGESLDYVGTDAYTALQTGEADITDGVGEWQFEIKYPDWGRYLVRAQDTNGKHMTGKIVYIDWPGWAGRAQKDSPGGASVLTFSSDKDAYLVGETVKLTIPTGKKGRALVSLENGSRMIQAGWLDASGEAVTTFEFVASEAMAPNIFAHVTFLQPHTDAGNDLPIRMYGVIPIAVENPGTRLQPEVETPETFLPEEKAEISVREASGKPMTYTVAIVDEGLLDLTRFKTPRPRDHFYKREALGVSTWDLYDLVAGAYGEAYEKLLAIGGDGEADDKGEKKARRFPPMVRFMGPFVLEAGKTDTHVIDIPQYVGSVRVMVVGGQDGAFGSCDKSVFVRKPLMVLVTLPRVLGPDETVEMPVSVFALDENVKNVSLTVETEGPVALEGPEEKSIAFSEIGDDLVFFKLKAASRTGIAKVSVRAKSQDAKAGQDIELDVRMPGGAVTDVVDAAIEKGETWKQKVTFPGMAGTNAAILEVSRIPPINLGKRLSYLIQYPHGCVEQTTSAVFPQVHLDKLVKLSPQQADMVQKHVSVAINKLLKFQQTNGGFAYWPGQAHPEDWSSSYVGHFLLEAERAGYVLPSGMKQRWVDYQKNAAGAWERGEDRSDLIQAYRLYTLALAGQPELGAMNRLREDSNLSVAARWRCAAAYQLAGHPEAASQLVRDGNTSNPKYRELSNTYGSDFRDDAMVLEALCLMKRLDIAKPIALRIAENLGKNGWLSTQETAFGLIAMARYSGLSAKTGELRFDYSWNGGKTQTVISDSPIVQIPLETGDANEGDIVFANTCDITLHNRVILTGTPPPGTEKSASNGMNIVVRYLTLEGGVLNHAALEQGTDFAVEVQITNTGHAGDYQELALSHIFPSGWEIHNTRMDPTMSSPGSEFNYQDIRDDRIYTYVDIRQGETKTIKALVNSSYLGRFYLPMVSAEAMYDATINARVAGQWVEVVKPGKE